MKIGIFGDGFVGSAIRSSLEIKKFIYKETLFIYDKYKICDYTSNIEDLLNVDIMFLCLPTQYHSLKETYDLAALEETLEYLSKNNYNGICLIKSTILPNTTKTFSEKYINLKLIHNPEFLSANTAFEDFQNQNHIVLGVKDNTEEYINIIKDFYAKYYPNAKISIMTSTESELMKLSANCFYSVKIQFFTEIYLLCKKLNCSYDTIRESLLKNGWINPMHTLVPGTDGNISYGGFCFPKDTMALDKYMEKNITPHSVLNSTIKERNTMRQDSENIKII
jgi:UDPglucose 6-dehydrogenase